MADIEYKPIPEKARSITQQNERYLNRGARRSRAAGGRTTVVFPGDDIQKAIDALKKEGGGRIYLRTGTHKPRTSLTIPSGVPIQIEGENTTSTIIDFNSTASRIIVAGTGIYTTGTVSITLGVTVTGSSTSWLSSGLVAGDQIFLDSRWYKIAAITGNTTIILSEGYSGGVLAGATYRAGAVAKDCEIKELTIQGCTSLSGALDGDDVRNLLLEDVQFISNTKAIVIKNFSEWLAESIIVVTSGSHGITFDTGTFCNNRQLATASNDGHGVVLISIKTGTFEFSSSNSNTADGYNITSCTDLFMSVQANANEGQGIECVSGNDNILIEGSLISGNITGGIMLTETTDNCRISTGKFTGNGGYGVNVAAATCDNNIIVSNVFAGNSSGAVNDLGTGTVIRGNVGVTDNDQSAIGPGFVMSYAGTSTPPTGWLTCDGSAVSRTTYAALFTAIGTQFGIGDGTTTFNLPNAKGRVVVGYNAAETEFDALGEIGGAKTHTLATSEIPAHTHTVGYDGGGGVVGAASNGNAGSNTFNTGSTGGAGAHNNLQPYITFHCVIKT